MHRQGDTGDADFRAFAALQLNALLRPAYYLAGDWDEAQDLVQSALVKMYLAWSRLGPDVDRHLYARKVLLNEFRGDRRRPWRRREVVVAHERDERPEPSGSFEERDYQRHLLLRLPKQQRAVVVLRYLQDLTVGQTAECLGVSEGTVKSQTSDALRALRALVAREGSEA